jgi:hypothetical protein
MKEEQDFNYLDLDESEEKIILNDCIITVNIEQPKYWYFYLKTLKTELKWSRYTRYIYNSSRMYRNNSSDVCSHVYRTFRIRQFFFENVRHFFLLRFFFQLLFFLQIYSSININYYIVLLLLLITLVYYIIILLYIYIIIILIRLIFIDK